MELKLLEDFLSLAETRNFSRSAELRNVTQSALSRRIRSLEIWAGATLLDRSAYPVSLTSEGRQFLETAEEVVRLLAMSRSEFVSRRPRSKTSIVSVTGLHTLCLTFLPEWLVDIRSVVGEITTQVLPDNYDVCVQALVDGGYDLLLTYHHLNVPIALDAAHYHNLVVGYDALIPVIAPPGKQLWNQTSQGFPLLQYSRGSFLGLIASFAQAGQLAPPAYLAHTNESSMADALKFMALAGHGMAWLPRSLVHVELASGTLLAAGPSMPMEIRAYRSKERKRPFLDRVWRAASELAPRNYAAAE